MKITKREENNPQISTSLYTPVRSIFDDFFRTPSLVDDVFNRTAMPSYSNLSADIWEEDQNYFVKMALPGVSKDEINIEIDQDVIRISGSKKLEEKDEGKRKYYFRSLDTRFEQSFNLPTVVNAEKAEASFKDGVLEVKLPKAEQYKPKKIEISS